MEMSFFPFHNYSGKNLTVFFEVVSAAQGLKRGMVIAIIDIH
jgi:hypothetical protein